MLMEPNWAWNRARDELVEVLAELGQSAALGECIARHLGSPRAIERMTAYLRYARPASAEMIVDEMLSISAEIEAWRAKKASEEANGVINELRWRRERGE